MPTMSPTVSTCAATSNSIPASIGADYDEAPARWSVTTSDGDTVSAQGYVVLATGCLSNARMPDIKGLGDFKGKVYHTGHWPHQAVDFTGLRVGVIGTGSSAIQSVPVIAEQASHLTVFQRTANFSIPARNAALTAEERAAFRAKYPEIRRFAREEARNGIYTEMPDRGALDDGENERRAKYEARWAAAGSPSCRSTTISRSTRPPTTPPPISSAKRSPRSSSDPGNGKAAAAQRSSDRLEADLRRYRLFRRPSTART